MQVDLNGALPPSLDSASREAKLANLPEVAHTKMRDELRKRETPTRVSSCDSSRPRTGILTVIPRRRESGRNERDGVGLLNQPAFSHVIMRLVDDCMQRAAAL
ncbi:hypothetical protein CPLU01_02818 [Colletotrichum plurivorum]|uniref:Uncharacterized protein n=1 Tax=Colletotrichum plurivorum TaxID=2175906 RepID=A0A8H6NLD4_9PEZI|nr:hypothetical protein CPLU01_02818 [Colletotrichum plurivorum]